ncbi:MAG: hypothetical protein K6D95_03460 [Treponema sp.]|nr:hypothetical protein [Treponema sp.]
MSNKQDTRRMLVSGNVFKTMLTLSVPAVLGAENGVLGVGVSAMLMQVMSMVQQTILYNTAAKWGGSEWQTILGAVLSSVAPCPCSTV